MFTCVVYGCSNSSITNSDPAVHYYIFPKHPAIAQQWMQASGWQADQIDLNTARICSIHFDESSYTTEIKMIDYIACYTRVLKYDAVPTLYLPTTQIIIKETESGNQEALKGMIVFTVPATQENMITVSSSDSQKEYIELRVQSSAIENIQVQSLKTEQIDKTNNEENNQIVERKYEHIKNIEQLHALQEENRKLRKKIADSEANLKRCKAKATKLAATYREEDLELNKVREDYLKTKQSFLSLQEQKSLLAKVFSESQIKILSGKKKIYWSNDDMAVGYTIRHLSNKRCYLYLSKNLNIPLPAVSSIKRWMNTKNEIKKSMALKKDDDESE